LRGRKHAHKFDISWNADQEVGTVRALLGPTNTGKTHFAIDRMLGHASGMIGFPLRLLARENYDRIVSLKGVRSVALITGEEKLIPPNPRWFICTVEAMPLGRAVEFLAVDEIQLCADIDRGYIFTDRLLHARGLSETVFMGSDTMAPILRALVPGIRIDERLRMSTLTYVGAANLSRLPRRSAIVGFSVDRVYELAERIRRQKGGAAVVLGALSPRTRNAQVAMYEAGEVDYMVATDAIGMGLNMDVNHVAFSGMRKFDGRHSRMLSPGEVGQIAGRAGRHMNDGTFGTTAAHGPLSPELVEAVEAHHFDPVRKIFWRSRDLDFSSSKLLLRSLGHGPRRPELSRAREAEDQAALGVLAKDETIVARAFNPGAVRLLWDVCQIPDFRKIMPDHHAAFLSQVYLHLTDTSGWLPEDWVGEQVDRLNNVSGDIDALTGRLADIRIWTYISQRSDWLGDPAYWQGQAGAIEDRLSDALHDRLTLRFVDRRAASIDRKKGAGTQLLSAVTAAGDVIVEGQSVGRMEGVEFVELENLGSERRAVLAAARRAAAESIGTRVRGLLAQADTAFALTDSGKILWEGTVIARLGAGEALISPDIRIVRSDLLDNLMKEQIRSHLAAWFVRRVDKVLKPLVDARESNVQGTARGVVFRLYEHLGALPGPLDTLEWQSLKKRDRTYLSKLGISMTPALVYFPGLQSASALSLRRILWSVHTGRKPPVIDGSKVICAAGQLSQKDWACLGFWRFGRKAIRLECLDKLSRVAHKKANRGAFVPTSQLLSMVGLGALEFEQVMDSLGYAAQKAGGRTEFRPKQRKLKEQRRPKGNPSNPDSPFASLRDLARAK
jgi:ATP-dependent RNA helicase SUPV3L1/SUV3